MAAFLLDPPTVDLEVQRGAELPEPRLQHPGRRQPRECWSGMNAWLQLSTGGIHDVVDVEADVGACPAEPEDLREPEVDLVHPIAKDVPGSIRLTVTFGALLPTGCGRATAATAR